MLNGGFAVARRGAGRRRPLGRAGPGPRAAVREAARRRAAPLSGGGRDLSLPLREGCGGVPRRCGPCPSVCPKGAIRVGGEIPAVLWSRFQTASAVQRRQMVVDCRR